MTNPGLYGMIVGLVFGAAAVVPFVVTFLRAGHRRKRNTGGLR